MKQLVEFITEAVDDIKLKQVSYLPKGIMTGKYDKYTILTAQKPGSSIFCILYFENKTAYDYNVFFANSTSNIGAYIKFRKKNPRMVKNTEIGPDGELRVFYTKAEPTMTKKLQKDLDVSEGDQKILNDWLKEVGFIKPFALIYAFIKKDKKWTLDEIQDNINEFGTPIDELKKLDSSRPLVIKYKDKFTSISSKYIAAPGGDYNYYFGITKADGAKPEKHPYMRETPEEAIDDIKTGNLGDIIEYFDSNIKYLVFIAANRDWIYNSDDGFRIFKPISYTKETGYNVIEVELLDKRYKLKPLEGARSVRE